MSALEPLQPAEARVLGVLIEKSLTTPDGYPLSLNALVNGCNQKSNRDPVTAYDEASVEAAVRDLRMNHLAREVTAAGARVVKFAHRADERLDLDERGLAVIAELLMRGPQTLGELRGRAARMAPFDTVDDLRPVLDALTARGLVAPLPPAAGSRAARVTQRLAPGLHAGDTPPAASPEGAAPPRPSAAPAGPSSLAPSRGADLAERVAALESAVDALRARLDRLEER